VDSIGHDWFWRRVTRKIPENYFKILEEGKNVGKFILRRNVKILEIFSKIMNS